MAEADERNIVVGDDLAIPEDALINLAHPINTKDYATYGEAQRMVGAKYSKGALIELVNWLLAERKAAALAAEQELQRLKDATAQASELFEVKRDLEAAAAHDIKMAAKLKAAQDENYALEARLKDATVEDARGVAVRLTRAEIAIVLSWGGVLTQPEARAGIAPAMLAKLRAIAPPRGQ
jgi:hypothetical protein